jgi:hypothetical protein
MRQKVGRGSLQLLNVQFELKLLLGVCVKRMFWVSLFRKAIVKAGGS